jgi:hypothetical protein
MYLSGVGLEHQLSIVVIAAVLMFPKTSVAEASETGVVMNKTVEPKGLVTEES